MMLSKDATTEKLETQKLRILVVDDDDLNRRMMQILLAREGHHVDLASNGMEALDAVKYQKYDIVFMDLQMPTMDGVEASRRIREWENGGTHTFIVALTASYMPEEGHRLFEVGIDNYLAKPFEVEHIQRMLHLISNPEHQSLIGANPGLHKTDLHDVLSVEKGIERVGGDLDTYRELLRDFVEELPRRIHVLEQHIFERNMRVLSIELHNLKGVSSNLGAMEMAAYADKLDKHGNAGYTPVHEGLLLELKKAEANLLQAANDFLGKKETVTSQAQNQNITIPEDE